MMSQELGDLVLCGILPKFQKDVPLFISGIEWFVN